MTTDWLLSCVLQVCMEMLETEQSYLRALDLVMKVSYILLNCFRCCFETIFKWNITCCTSYKRFVRLTSAHCSGKPTDWNERSHPSMSVAWLQLKWKLWSALISDQSIHSSIAVQGRAGGGPGEGRRGHGDEERHLLHLRPLRPHHPGTVGTVEYGRMTIRTDLLSIQLTWWFAIWHLVIWCRAVAI